MQTVIDNILTNYEILGSKNQKTILILHGWGQSLENWRYVANKLSEKYKVVLLDLPGFGSSSQPEKSFNTQDYSDFIIKFVKKVNIDRFILVGHSFGGKISIKLASQNNNIEKLFLISPSGFEDISFLGTLKIYIAKIINLLFFWLPQNVKEKIVYTFASQDYINAGKMLETFKKVVHEKAAFDATKIAVPTIIVWGEYDKEVKLNTSRILKGLIHNSILRILWGVGHSPNIEVPEKLVNLLLEYL